MQFCDECEIRFYVTRRVLSFHATGSVVGYESSRQFQRILEQDSLLGHSIASQLDTQITPIASIARKGSSLRTTRDEKVQQIAATKVRLEICITLMSYMYTETTGKPTSGTEVSFDDRHFDRVTHSAKRL